MELVIGILIGLFTAGMVYLRRTAKLTKTTVDDKLLEAGEKVEPIVDKFAK